jgi:hypothetical protein
MDNTIKILDNYIIHSTGKVFSVKSNKFLSQHKCNSGYYQICLCSNGKAKNVMVHRLVAIYFIPNPENKPCVNHKDGNKLNNDVLNLEWCTYRENSVHAQITGLSKKPPSLKGKFGKDHNRSILVKQFDLNGNLIAEYNGLSEAYRNTSILVSSISYAAKHNTSLKGYKWRVDNLSIRVRNKNVIQGTNYPKL